MKVRCFAAASLLSVSAWGCNLVGASCLAQQQRGTAQPIAGVIEAGQTVVHRLSYEARGSQNDVEISWSGQTDTNGARLRVYATKVGCETGPRSGSNAAGDCQILSTAGTLDSGNIATRLILTHGRGNPEVLGTPPEFKVWVVGDTARSTAYTLTQTWFFGPDC
jgi:hypothetical protein